MKNLILPAINRADAEEAAPQFWVYEGDICRAAQATFYGALQYLKPGRIIVTMPRKVQS